jgi:N6-L-threonylcarbamoyladenine synthase
MPEKLPVKEPQTPAPGSQIVILAIESSCDETSAAVCAGGKILSNQVANQTIHEKYGGVVPELASRAHMQHIVPVVDIALKNAFPDQTPDSRLQTIDAVAFTQSPGLIGSLLVGAQFAKSLALVAG